MLRQHAGGIVVAADGDAFDASRAKATQLFGDEYAILI
jgi:hypothetical protein